MRSRLRRLSGNILTYTYEQAEELRASEEGLRIFTAPNAQMSRSQMGATTRGGLDFVSVSRLVAAKKPDLVVRAFSRVVRASPHARLVLVGDGPLRPGLEKLAAMLGVKECVTFAGQVADPGALSEVYGSALCAISGGYVGLSATQAFGFGVPLIYPEPEPHAPEVALATPRNSLKFQADNEEDLARKMAEVIASADSWDARRSEIANLTRETYSAESMAEGFRVAVSAVQGSCKLSSTAC